MNFTTKLEQRRKELGMTFEALSKRSEVPVSTLKAIFKKGVEHATFANVTAIANALGMRGFSVSCACSASVYLSVDLNAW